MATVAPEISVLARDEAFEKLYRRYVKDVYHYALALLRNPADAEDVTQTTFMNAYRAYRRGDEILKPHNWLIKIAHNVARTRYARMSRRVKEVPLEEHVEHLALPEEERPNVEGVLRALGRLPFNQRAALIMRELEGRSYSEIADTLGVSVPAVETLIFRARRSLRVRTAALRSIAMVPVPSSLTQLFESGGAVAAGVGAGFVVKAAVALVAGGLATGLGGDYRGRAIAVQRADATKVASVAQSAAAGLKRPAARAQQIQRRAAQRLATRPDGVAALTVPAAPVRGSSLPLSAPPQGGSLAQAPVQLSSPTVAATVSGPAETVVGGAEQVVAAQTTAMPLAVPALPALPARPAIPALPALPPVALQPPALPKLP